VPTAKPKSPADMWRSSRMVSAAKLTLMRSMYANTYDSIANGSSRM
jgi:hypothetical protein